MRRNDWSPFHRRYRARIWLTLLLMVSILLFAACDSGVGRGEQARAELPAAASSASTGPSTPSPTSTAEPTAAPTEAPTATFTPLPTSTATSTPAPTPTIAPTMRIAVIGDYGLAGSAAEEVAGLVKEWNPNLIITLGDNNYPAGAASTIDQNIGQYYHEYIAPYRGRFSPGSDRNRFFPVLGNHDWQTANARPYLDYFTLPGNERYYAFTAGPARLFALDSHPEEPDGVSEGSRQARWLRDELDASRACWNIVYMHHAPFSSGLHGSSRWMQWPYDDWGVDAVLAGHDHHYERIVRDGTVYFVNGLGGGARYGIGKPVSGSEVRYRAEHGAMLMEIVPERITFQFVNRSGDPIDTFELSKPCRSGQR